MDCSTSGSSVLHCLPEFGQIQATELVMLSNHLILCSPLLLPSVFPSIRICSNEPHFSSGGQSIGASASVLPMNIQDWFPLRFDWFNPFAVQETLKSFLQHYSSKASIFRSSAFFMVQLSKIPLVAQLLKNLPAMQETQV